MYILQVWKKSTMIAEELICKNPTNGMHRRIFYSLENALSIWLNVRGPPDSTTSMLQSTGMHPSGNVVKEGNIYAKKYYKKG